jgi:hypothetical protein
LEKIRGIIRGSSVIRTLHEGPLAHGRRHLIRSEGEREAAQRRWCLTFQAFAVACKITGRTNVKL